MIQSDGRKYTEVTIVSKIHKRCNLTTTCKKEVVPATFKGEKSIQQIAAEYEIHPDLVSKWKAQGLKLLDDGFKPSSKSERKRYEDTIAHLQQQLVQRDLELSWLSKKCKELGL